MRPRRPELAEGVQRLRLRSLEEKRPGRDSRRSPGLVRGARPPSDSRSPRSSLGWKVAPPRGAKMTAPGRPSSPARRSPARPGLASLPHRRSDLDRWTDERVVSAAAGPAPRRKDHLPVDDPRRVRTTARLALYDRPGAVPLRIRPGRYSIALACLVDVWVHHGRLLRNTRSVVRAATPRTGDAVGDPTENRPGLVHTAVRPRDEPRINRLIVIIPAIKVGCVPRGGYRSVSSWSSGASYCSLPSLIPVIHVLPKGPDRVTGLPCREFTALQS